MSVPRRPDHSLRRFTRNDAACRFKKARGFVQIDTSDGSRNAEREPDALYRWVAVA